jgi:hypothetical protein
VINYLYAVAEGITDVGNEGGVSGEPLEVRIVGNLLVVVGQVVEVPTVSAETLQSQDRVIRHLHAHAKSLLPARFGAAFASDHDLQSALQTQAAGLGERLARVRGCEQMTLRILRAAHVAEASATPPTPAPAVPVSATSSGTAYLLTRARPPEIAPLLDALTPIVRGTRVERGRVPDLVATVYHLVDRGKSDAYRMAAQEAATALATLRVRMNGPSPCYAFARE